ncbi:uncharacterized protein LOC133777703 isoform X2 [Humulus lupulus]|uniref:uncharacterized protein LOC133777703 isoform X2 n=1 Tax=Humulus lupulus TaxID=3486 RepID=UPI002B410059|nr:uncharacterized protein LOC133777703 isoform X2 [Humulus lupulus]
MPKHLKIDSFKWARSSSLFVHGITMNIGCYCYFNLTHIQWRSWIPLTFNYVEIKNIVRLAFTLYDTEKGKRVCRQQPKTTECGIYCMKYARDLISQQRTRAYLSNNFNSDLPYTNAELNEVQEEWATYILPHLAK